jgi:lysine-N-methylase
VVPDKVTDALPPNITPDQHVEWPDFRRFVRALDETFQDDGSPLVIRLLRALAWMGLVAQSRFDKVLGDRLGEFLELVVQSAQEDVPASLPEILETAGEPSRLGRTQFRLLAGQYARKDTYASMDGTWRGRWRLLKVALRLSRGKGDVPAIQERFREVPFDRLERDFGGVPDGADEILTRYYRVKIQALAFCGRPYYDVPLVEGFYALALVYPAVLWIARWLAASDDRNEIQTTDVVEALTIADHHHGYSPAFGTWGFRRRVRTLGQLGDIPRLAAWYSR